MEVVMKIGFICFFLFISCGRFHNRGYIEEGGIHLSLNLQEINDLKINKDHDVFIITTQGPDPYIFSNPLRKSLESESVLTFDYISSEDFSLQLFFSPPTTESRSVKDMMLNNTQDWKTFSVDVKEQMGRYDWGNNGDLLRIDLGDKKGIDIKIKNIRFRFRNKEEEEAAQQREDFLQNDLELSEAISKYLDSDFPAHLSSVNVLKSDVIIQGSIPAGSDNLFLLELMPGVSLFDLEESHNAIPISENDFEIKQDRVGTNDGVQYDRLLSRWVIIEKTQNGSKMLSHVHYADVVEPKWSMPKSDLSHKKGLGGFHTNPFVDDLGDLGIGSITVNVRIPLFFYLKDPGNAIAHEYQEKSYYFDKDYIDDLDEVLRMAFDRDIIVSAIILVNSAAESADPKVGELLEHPEFTPGENVHYTMPRLDNIETKQEAVKFTWNEATDRGDGTKILYQFRLYQVGNK